MNNVYNSIISSYLQPKKADGRKDTVHGEKGLADHSKEIKNFNKKLPIYIINVDEKKRDYVFGLKDSSMDVMREIDRYCNSVEENFTYRKAYTDDSAVGAVVVSDDYDKLPEEFDIRILGLAGKQINRSQPYYEDGKGMSKGDYQVNLDIGGKRRVINYTVTSNTTNKSLMNDFAKILNRGNYGINASVKSFEKNKVFLEIESSETGTDGGRVFSLSDVYDNNKMIGIVGYYGFDNVAEEAHNLKFELNGKEKFSHSNELMINKSLILNVHATTQGNVHVGYVPDGAKAVSAIKNVIDSYNGMVETDKNYSKLTGENTRLSTEFEYIYNRYSHELAKSGVTRDEEGHLVLDENKAMKAFENGDFQKTFSKDSPFLNEINRKFKSISLNPLEYTKKIMVAYPDYSKEGVGKQYMTSIFSGMFFNYYC